MTEQESEKRLEKMFQKRLEKMRERIKNILTNDSHMCEEKELFLKNPESMMRIYEKMFSDGYSAASLDIATIMMSVAIGEEK